MPNITWLELLRPETRAKAQVLLERARTETDAGIELYPPQDSILRALDLTPPHMTKIVIVGQDPYHTPGQADGLAFSVSSGNGIQPSLQNIFKELHDDVGVPVPSHGDLSKWAAQGVLLLNTSLTVYRGRPESCRDWGWDDVTSEVLLAAMTKCPQPVMFLCWGSKAIKFFDAAALAAQGKLSDDQADQAAMRANLLNKFVIKSTHPSPFSAARPTAAAPAFLGSRPFSQANAFLTANGSAPVDWSL